MAILRQLAVWIRLIRNIKRPMTICRTPVPVATEPQETKAAAIPLPVTVAVLVIYVKVCFVRIAVVSAWAAT